MQFVSVKLFWVIREEPRAAGGDRPPPRGRAVRKKAQGSPIYVIL